ncbi:Retrovirus-related Pol polyprotein from transposon RE1 [Senna tora]|uniref:Retrovirus-related Pol polyprotein from transposon RE1 n=1 Tax=Senna tora TaxID=362788 RepID=A0A834TP70_9FABA|nr:Retrovirus-related Pol polyprotein from transposon RE1 [Senna tora]
MARDILAIPISTVASESTFSIGKKRIDERPYMLHNYDHPRMALVNTPLTGTNYLTWSLAMMTSLEAKDKLGFVHGSLLALTDET